MLLTLFIGLRVENEKETFSNIFWILFCWINICVVIQEMMELGIKSEFVVEEKVNIESNQKEIDEDFQ